jgi:hypothetical protein
MTLLIVLEYLAMRAAVGIVRIFSQPVSLTSDDAQNIATIIRAGRENNVKKFEIELNSEIVQGIDLKGLETSENVNITLGQKGKSSYKLTIEYKE